MSDDRGRVWDTLLIIFSNFEGWFCVLSGFFDETFKQKGQHMTGVGGFIFRKESLSALQLELGSVEGAKTSASQLRWRGKTDTLNTVAKIVARHRGTGFVCTVTHDVFEKWQRSNPENATWLGKPYGICLLKILGMVRDYVSRHNEREEVFYTIESGADGRKEAENFLRLIETRERTKSWYRLRGYTFLPKEGPIARYFDRPTY